jgi:hypothetical protein
VAELEGVASVEPEDTYHKPDTLFRIAIWAGWISWAFLVVALMNFGLRIYNNYYPMIASGQLDFRSVLYILINEAYTLLFMAFVFLVLQGVSQGGYLLMDLFENNSK